MKTSTDSDPVPEDVWVCSVDVGSDMYGNEHLNPALQEHYVLKQAVNHWQGPKYSAYCLLIERVRSFDNVDWPKTSSTAVSLAEAGFLYDGELTTF